MKEVQLITLNPGHFHAALVQKSMYPQVNSVVYVYAPPTDELEMHLSRVSLYNSRKEEPTSWNEIIYKGDDFLEKMISEKKGNLVVISGNNQSKTNYISQSIDAGFNVLADKPMAINLKDFEVLKTSFETAKKKNILLYDIMTERYEITTQLQKELSQIPEIFGTLETGSTENPAVTKESVHHFFKYVSGTPLTRPSWFMDEEQQGDGIVDVTTHLVDLVQWECFPDQIIDYTKDINIISAKRWPTEMSLSQFKAITKSQGFPKYLNKNKINDTTINVFSNGEINYRLKGTHVKVSVRWAYQAPEGSSDAHYSIMRGTKANLIIRQGAEQKFKPTLYLEPTNKNNENYEQSLMESFKSLTAKYPGIELSKTKAGWIVVIPEKYKEGHEAHFARVMEKFLDYLKNKKMPAWEVPNMISKYYTTTKALELSK